LKPEAIKKPIDYPIHILTETPNHTYSFGKLQDNYSTINKCFFLQTSIKPPTPKKSEVEIVTDDSEEEEETERIYLGQKSKDEPLYRYNVKKNRKRS